MQLLAERTVGFFEFVESSAGVKMASHDIPPFVCAALAALCLCDGHIIPRLLAIHNIGMLHRFKVGNLRILLASAVRYGRYIARQDEE